MKLSEFPLGAAALCLPWAARASEDATTAAPGSTTTLDLAGHHSTDGEEWLGMPFTVGFPVIVLLVITVSGCFYFRHHISDAFLTTARTEEAKSCMHAGHATQTMTAIEMFNRGARGYERVWLCDLCGRKSAEIAAEFERCDVCRVNFCSMCMRERSTSEKKTSRFSNSNNGYHKQKSLGELAFGPGGANEPDPEGGNRAGNGDDASSGSYETPRRALEGSGSYETLDAHIVHKPQEQNWKPDSGIVCNERKLPSSAYAPSRQRQPQAAWLSRLMGSCATTCCGDSTQNNQQIPVGRPLKAANV